MQVKWIGLGLSSLKSMQINNKSGLYNLCTILHIFWSQIIDEQIEIVFFFLTGKSCNSPYISSSEHL